MRVPLRGLRPFTNYSLQVVAMTRKGEGPPSDPVYCTTEEDGKEVLLANLIILLM